MSIVTEINWTSNQIDYRDIESYWEYLKDRQHEAQTCDWCWEQVTVVEGHTVPVHTASGLTYCDPEQLVVPVDEGVRREAKPQGEALDWDEEADLAMITSLDEQTPIADQAREGASLISESYWVQYAEEWARDIHEIPDWLDSHIDWEGFADSLAQDYTEIELKNPHHGTLEFRTRQS